MTHKLHLNVTNNYKISLVKKIKISLSSRKLDKRNNQPCFTGRMYFLFYYLLITFQL